ncbi:MAG: amino acid permease, partial [Candidatus Acidiferrales bacterium]
MSLTDTIIGKPLATSEEEHSARIGVAAGIPIFGLDALTSAAYGPEAAMTLLIPLGIYGLHYVVPLVTAILILLGIVFFSYLQTIAAYPNGGGSYTVAMENLGTGPALLAAAALMIDYILTAAVGISAGVAALTSAVPRLQPDTLVICLVILAILAVVNLRGVKEAGSAFIAPTFLFVGTLLVLIGVGVYHTIMTGGHPIPVTAPPPALPATVKYLGLWLLLKSFSNGCAAMTGVEAVSNGVTAFAEPRAKKAQTSLTVIIGTLVVLLFGTTYLARAYGITAMEPTVLHYQTIVSILTTAVFGRGWFY